LSRSAVNRQAVGSNPNRGANLSFFNQLELFRTFGLEPNAFGQGNPTYGAVTTIALHGF
jgi:hypothetical protein